MGWAGKQNGKLLAVAAAEFDVFLTVDRNLTFQQDIGKFNIAVVVLRANSNKYTVLRLLVPQLLTVLDAVTTGQVINVGA